MRNELQKREGRRGTFTALFLRFGQKAAYKGAPIVTALFVDVRDDAGQLVTDHLWFKVGRQFAALRMEAGDKVQFEARVASYVKGYRGRRDDWDEEGGISVDYCLKFPTRVRLLRAAGEPSLPLFQEANA